MPMSDVIAVILGGGRGTRLFPLTLHRSKPAVPIAAKYRLIDIPISNCLNSDVRRMWVLTQYNSESLNKHISQTYKFDLFSRGFVSILAAEQTEDRPDWFQGTADAVRQIMRHIVGHRYSEVLILSGDQLYHMDYRRMLETHRRTHADVTVAVIGVPAEQTSGFGILKMNGQGRIVHFDEKPPADRLPGLVSDLDGTPGFIASMGLYVFSREALDKSLADVTQNDFGRHVLPSILPRLRVQAHLHRGYWEDVGTIRSYYEANLALCQPVPPFDFYDVQRPVYTHPRLLPPSKVEQCTIDNALVSEGSVVVGATVFRSVLGIRSRIGARTTIRESVVQGADYYETVDEIARAHAQGRPPIGIGDDTVIERAIIDKNARVGRGVRIVNEAGLEEHDGDGWYIRDGIVIVPKDGVVHDGTVI
jgi:glucose-1-phosphate adenylyltransferase